MSEVISVYAPIRMDPTDSYGLIGCELVRHLGRLGYHVNAIAPAEPSNLTDYELIRSMRKPILAAGGGILLGYPTAYPSYGELANLHPKIAVTMFESTKLPDGWIEELNKCDAVIVPSFFVYNTFRECGVTSKIYIFPLGIGEAYNYQDRSLDLPFTFLAFLDRGKRKGGLYVLEAFADEFGDNTDVKLIFKHKELTTEKPKLVSGDPNIEYIYENFTDIELNELYGSCHCLVNPNKGEGFGLIPREFAATGGISLTTNWGGTADMLGLWGWPISYELEVADWKGIKNLQGQDLGMWAKPDMEDLRLSMREVFEHRETYLRRARQKARFAKKFYSWDHFGRNVDSIWKALRYGNSIRSEGIQETYRI